MMGRRLPCKPRLRTLQSHYGGVDIGDYSGFKETVRDRTDWVALVSEHLVLRSQGRRLVGLCPFGYVPAHRRAMIL